MIRLTIRWRIILEWLVCNRREHDWVAVTGIGTLGGRSCERCARYEPLISFIEHLEVYSPSWREVQEIQTPKVDYGPPEPAINVEHW